jgi:hypothetical protein
VYEARGYFHVLSLKEFFGYQQISKYPLWQPRDTKELTLKIEKAEF